MTTATPIRIRGAEYHAEPIDPGCAGTAAVRLTTPKGDVYDVVREHDGIISCTCAHYEFRIRGNSRALCKHGSAILEIGLLD